MMRIAVTKLIRMSPRKLKAEEPRQKPPDPQQYRRLKQGDNHRHLS
jgi:hypothetical protein